MTEPGNGRHVPVLAIDGPGGAGKGTISRLVAGRLGWHLLDSGALYRLVALDAVQRGVPLDAEPALAALANDLDTRFQASGDRVQVLLNGADVSDAIRTETAGEGASRVAALPGVRSALIGRHSSCSGSGGRWPRYGGRGLSRRGPQSVPDGEC
jgi:cytidylate kinase